MRWRVGILSLILAGCGTESSPQVGTAQGRVLFEGRPLSGGMVVFSPHPDRGPICPLAVGQLTGDGTFRLSSEGSPYLIPGWYRVAIAEAPGSTGVPFPTELRSPEYSGIEREIKPGRDNCFELSIELRR